MGYERHQYEWREDARGNRELVVLDIPVMSGLSWQEHEDLPEGCVIDRKALEAMVIDWRAREEKFGIAAFLFLGHNKSHQEAPVIGRLDNVRLSGDWIRADAVIKDSAAQEMALKDLLPKWSAEFAPERKILYGLSLILGQDGFFAEAEAAFLLGEERSREALAMLRARDAEGVRVCHAENPLPFQLSEKESAMDPKDKEIADLKAKLEAAEKDAEEKDAKLAALAEEKDAKLAALADEKKEEEEAKLAADEKADEKKKADDEESAKMADKSNVRMLALSAKAEGCHLPMAEIEKQLAALKTPEARELKATELAKLAKPDDKADLAKGDNDRAGLSGKTTRDLAKEFDTEVRKVALSDFASLAKTDGELVAYRAAKDAVRSRNPKLVEAMKLKANDGSRATA